MPQPAAPCVDADLRSTCSDPDDELPPTVDEAFDCSLTVADALTSLRELITPVAADTPGLPPPDHVKLSVAEVIALTKSPAPGFRTFVRTAYELLEAKDADRPACYVFIEGDRGSHLPFLLAVGLVLLGHVRGRWVCVYLNPGHMGGAGSHMTARRLLTLQLREVRGHGGAPPSVCVNDVVHAVWNTGHLLRD